MNQHSSSLFTSPTSAWIGFVTLLGTALLVCLPVIAAQEMVQQSTWSATGSIGTARVLHTATLLANGKVLVAGGLSVGLTVTASAELYDPATGILECHRKSGRVAAQPCCRPSAEWQGAGGGRTERSDNLERRGTLRPRHRCLEPHRQSHYRANVRNGDAACQRQGAGRWRVWGWRRAQHRRTVRPGLWRVEFYRNNEHSAH